MRSSRRRARAIPWCIPWRWHSTAATTRPTRPKVDADELVLDSGHAPAQRYGRQLLEHGDPEHLRPRVLVEHLRPGGRAGWSGAGGDQADHPRAHRLAGTVPSAPGRGAVRARPALLDRRP